MSVRFKCFLVCLIITDVTGRSQIHTSQRSALTIRDLSVKLINGHFDVRLTLGDGALQMLLNVRQELQ